MLKAPNFKMLFDRGIVCGGKRVLSNFYQIFIADKVSINQYKSSLWMVIKKDYHHISQQ
jgi:hypothetical protein